MCVSAGETACSVKEFLAAESVSPMDITRPMKAVYGEKMSQNITITEKN
jgi:hypothetical protein